MQGYHVTSHCCKLQHSDPDQTQNQSFVARLTKSPGCVITDFRRAFQLMFVFDYLISSFAGDWKFFSIAHTRNVKVQLRLLGNHHQMDSSRLDVVDAEESCLSYSPLEQPH